MLSGDLEVLSGIVEYLQDHDEVNYVALEDFSESGIAGAASAQLEISFAGPPESTSFTRGSGVESLTAATRGPLDGDREGRSSEGCGRDLHRDVPLGDRSSEIDMRDPETVNEETADEKEVTADEPEDESEDEFWCGRCGHGPVTESGVSIHNGHVHNGDPIVLDEEPDEDDLVEDVEDEEPEPADSPEEGQEDEDVDEESEDDYQVGDPVPEKSEETTEEAASDGGQVALPAGLTEEFVREAVAGHERLYEVTDALNTEANSEVTDGQVRSFLHALNVYGDVRDVSRRRGGAS